MTEYLEVFPDFVSFRILELLMTEVFLSVIDDFWSSALSFLVGFSVTV